MRFLPVLIFVSQLANAQFAPPQGQAGSTAMYKDSSAFVGWATSAKITRGLQDISNASSGYATVGDSLSPVGIADGNVVSLGDGGYAICTFTNAIFDGEGYDFAVFENSFDGNYLELGFVEVSSDGINFFRFPATSNTEDTIQTGSFNYTDATKLNNLAGKYIAQFGTPFDLSEIQGISGLDINHITHVKIVDVIGSINNQYATYDVNNHKINDPWPTPYPSCGFDLDAIGVIHEQTYNSIQQVASNHNSIMIYPNPVHSNLNISGFNNQLIEIIIYDVLGNIIKSEQINSSRIDVSSLENGVYFLHINDITQKIIISR